MDKNTITGLVLIGILLVGFSYLSRPSEEQIAAQKKYYDSIAVVQQQQEALKAKTEAALANENKGAAAAADSSALFFNAMHGTDSKVSIQNSVAEITFTTKGGRVYSAMLKEYKGQDKTNPVVLFDGDDATMSFNFYNKQGAIQTKDYYFEAVNKTDSSVTMRLAADNASYIDFIYTLKPNSYLMNFEIKATGMEGKLASTEYVDIDWTQRARQLEKGFTYENRLSELTYKVKDESVVTVSADGKVTIKGTGTTDVVITAARTDAYEWASKTIHISVRGVVKKKSQTITVADIISIYEGNTVALDAATDGDGTISYVSDDKTVASVDASGKVCGIKQGTAHITVLASETELYHASETIVTVTVKPKKTQSNTDPGKKPSDNVSKDDSQTTEDKKPSDGGNNTSGTTDGQQTKKKQTIKAKNITKTYSTKTFSIGAKTNGGGKLTYKVADKKIATISKTGKIKLKNYGQTKITIKAAAKGKYKAATKTITLTVKPVKVKVISVKQLKAKTLQVHWSS
mgnify:CR=1 FL=1